MQLNFNGTPLAQLFVVDFISYYLPCSCLCYPSGMGVSSYIGRYSVWIFASISHSILLTPILVSPLQGSAFFDLRQGYSACNGDLLIHSAISSPPLGLLSQYELFSTGIGNPQLPLALLSIDWHLFISFCTSLSHTTLNIVVHLCSRQLLPLFIQTHQIAFPSPFWIVGSQPIIVAWFDITHWAQWHWKPMLPTCQVCTIS